MDAAFNGTNNYQLAQGIQNLMDKKYYIRQTRVVRVIDIKQNTLIQHD